MQKVITGHWDGEPIWRWRTVQEELLFALWENEQLRKKKIPPTQEQIDEAIENEINQNLLDENHEKYD